MNIDKTLVVLSSLFYKCRWLLLFSDLQRILTKSRDYDELVHVWKSYRDAAGKPIAGKYLRFVELGNEAARINGKRLNRNNIIYTV